MEALAVATKTAAETAFNLMQQQPGEGNNNGAEAEEEEEAGEEKNLRGVGIPAQRRPNNNNKQAKRAICFASLVLLTGLVAFCATTLSNMFNRLVDKEELWNYLQHSLNHTACTLTAVTHRADEYCNASLVTNATSP